MADNDTHPYPVTTIEQLKYVFGSETTEKRKLKGYLFSAFKPVSTDLVEECMSEVKKSIANAINNGTEAVIDDRYIKRCLRNEMILLKKKDSKKSKNEIPLDNVEFMVSSTHQRHTHNPETQALNKEIIKKILELLPQLSIFQQKVVILRRIYDVPNKLTAMILDAKEQAVSTELERGEIRLRKLLLGEEIDGYEVD